MDYSRRRGERKEHEKDEDSPRSKQRGGGVK